jgi:hypothetical protein
MHVAITARARWRMLALAFSWRPAVKIEKVEANSRKWMRFLDEMNLNGVLVA